ncbi:unnamed protein product, partial [marine sediment metagenome]
RIAESVEGLLRRFALSLITKAFWPVTKLKEVARAGRSVDVGGFRSAGLVFESVNPEQME